MAVAPVEFWIWNCPRLTPCAAVVIAELGVERDKLALKIDAVGGSGIESAGDAQGAGGGGIDVADDEVSAAAAGIGDLQAGSGGVQRGGDADAQGVGVDVVDNVAERGCAGQVDVAGMSAAVGDGNGSKRDSRSAVEGPDEDGIKAGDEGPRPGGCCRWPTR